MRLQRLVRFNEVTHSCALKTACHRSRAVICSSCSLSCCWLPVSYNSVLSLCRHRVNSTSLYKYAVYKLLVQRNCHVGYATVKRHLHAYRPIVAASSLSKQGLVSAWDSCLSLSCSSGQLTSTSATTHDDRTVVCLLWRVLANTLAWRCQHTHSTSTIDEYTYTYTLVPCLQLSTQLSGRRCESQCVFSCRLYTVCTGCTRHAPLGILRSLRS